MRNIAVASSSRQRNPPKQVWLPGLQVWAAVGDHPCTNKQSTHPAAAATGIMLACPAISPASQAAETVKSTEASASSQVVKASIVAQAAANEEIDDSFPTCPICKFCKRDIPKQISGPPLLLTCVCDCRPDRNS